jgi:hypothetical protein
MMNEPTTESASPSPNSSQAAQPIRSTQQCQAARKPATEAGVNHWAHFEVASGKDLPGNEYDVVCMFDALHDMGDPIGAASRIRQASDGTLLLVEPNAGDAVEQNLNPVARAFTVCRR